MLGKSILGLMFSAIFLSLAFDARAQDMTVQERYMTEPPLTILNARHTDEGLTVEVKNNGRALIEYFELHLGVLRVWAGRNSLVSFLELGLTLVSTVKPNSRRDTGV